MKITVNLILIFLSSSLLAQELKSIEPQIGQLLSFGPEVQKEWAVRDKAMKDLESGARSWDDLTENEQSIFEKYGEVYESMWDIIGGGCSWYCGAGLGTVTASSKLNSQGDNSYEPSNSNDLSYKTAWVEGVSGYGIGEYLEYEFPPEYPRITTVKVVNGYVKSKSAYSNNSRAKKLKMYVNGEPHVILNLKDLTAVQSFKVDPIGHTDRTNFEELKSKTNSKIRFEILDVYKGDKYDDVAITEIYFDGLDVHCLGKGTKISMADGHLKNIEELEIGDNVLSFNYQTNTYQPSEILELASPTHSNLIELTFSDGRTIMSTGDHPFFDGKRWLSFNPIKTRTDYNFDDVFQLELGSKLQTIEGLVNTISIKRTPISQVTYTIVKLEGSNTFIANGIIVGTEELRVPTSAISHSAFVGTEK